MQKTAAEEASALVQLKKQQQTTNKPLGNDLNSVIIVSGQLHPQLKEIAQY